MATINVMRNIKFHDKSKHLSEHNISIGMWNTWINTFMLSFLIFHSWDNILIIFLCLFEGNKIQDAGSVDGTTT